jgi:copper oxidase (laccase) domain-containing protein
VRCEDEQRVAVLERRKGGLVWLEAAGEGWRVAFSTRLGGVSQGPYASLNIGYSVADEPRAVAENRRRLAAALGLEVDDLVVPGQVHGTTLAMVGPGERGRGAFGKETVVSETDGLLTGEANVPLLVSSADCVPVAIVARGAQGAARIALVHAGWRGMLAGIVGRAARRLTDRHKAPDQGRETGAGGSGVRREHARLVAAVIGPSIGPCSFEVSDDVGRRFESAFPGAWRDGTVDLWRAAEAQLVRAGLEANAIRNPRVCTVCDRRFFSHRRDRGLTGRQAALAWLT